MNSPNHWEDEAGTGNKHWFFFIENAKNDGVVRGIFNEFLKPELEKHKRVFEALGSRTIVEPSENELSGLGFSSTKEDEIICRVSGKISRILKINF